MSKRHQSNATSPAQEPAPVAVLEPVAPWADGESVAIADEPTPRQLLDEFLAALRRHPKAKLLSTHYPGRPTNVQAIPGEPQFSQTLVALKFVIAE